jgi:hypothetical protein
VWYNKMETCIICLEEFPHTQVKKICLNCRESAICGGCRKSVVESGHLEILSNCPVCKIPTSFAFNPDFSPAFHFLTGMIWCVSRLSPPTWKTATTLYMTYNVGKSIILKHTTEHPAEKVKGWNILNFVTHVPYIVYDLFTYTRPSEEEATLNTYLTFQVATPIVLAGCIWAYKKLTGLFRQNP